MTVRILTGDCRDVLRGLPAESVHCCATSPPYWGLRDYDVAGQIGLEPDYQSYVAIMVEVFREVRRVLRKDGTLWLNLGDSYHNIRAGEPPAQTVHCGEIRGKINGGNRKPQAWLKPKDLCGIPWRVAFALQADGWYLRQDIIWSKPNPMPESVTDRCTKSHEYLFLLSKSERYYYDAEAIKEPAIYTNITGMDGSGFKDPQSFNGKHRDAKIFGARRKVDGPDAGSRNRRSVWEIATAPFPDAHFATFPPALIEPCIKAGTSEKGCCAKCGAPWVREVERVSASASIAGPKSQAKRDQGLATAFSGYADGSTAPKIKTIGWSPSCSCNAAVVPCTILDPFGGAGTTGLVADRLGRNAILIELNPSYAAMAESRLRGDSPLFAEVAAE